MFPYTLKRSKRKSIGLKITDDGEVIVTAPLKANKLLVDSVVNSKSGWINKKLTIIKNRNDLFKPKTYSHGEEFEYLGYPYSLCFLDNKSQVYLDKNNLSIGINNSCGSSKPQKEIIKNKIIAWYREQAQIYLDNTGHELANKIGVNPILIKEKAFPRSWGMCHNNGKIFINYKLIMAPKDIIDYVIIHELCHLIHPNHSKQFWDTVSKHCKNYQAHKTWLKDNGYKLEL